MVGVDAQQKSGAIICSSNGVIRKLTPEAAQLLGVRPNELTGKPVPLAFRSNGTIQHEGRILRFQNTDLDDQVFITVEDVSEQEAKIAQLHQSKLHLLGMVSHELRNPLAVIRLNAQLLLQHREQITLERLERHLRVIDAKVDHMNNILEDHMGVIHADNWRFQLQLSSVDLTAFLEEIIAEHQQRYPKTSFNLDFTGYLNPVMIDKKLLIHIMNNLLSNAVKYSPNANTVQVRADSKESEIRISVRDYGMGMDAEDLAHIFEPFYRGQGTSKIPGTGLGLSIVKRSVETHGGTIEVKSAIDQGTEVIVTLPRTDTGTVA